MAVLLLVLVSGCATQNEYADADHYEKHSSRPVFPKLFDVNFFGGPVHRPCGNSGYRPQCQQGPRVFYVYKIQDPRYGQSLYPKVTGTVGPNGPDFRGFGSQRNGYP